MGFDDMSKSVEISAHFRTIHIRSEAKSLNHISAKSILYDSFGKRRV